MTAVRPAPVKPPAKEAVTKEMAVPVAMVAATDPDDYADYAVAAADEARAAAAVTTVAPAPTRRKRRKTLVGVATRTPQTITGSPARVIEPAVVPEYDSYALAEDPGRTGRFQRVSNV